MAKAVTKYQSRDGKLHDSAKISDDYDLYNQRVKDMTEFFEGTLPENLDSTQWKVVDLAVRAILTKPAIFAGHLTSKLRPAPNAKPTSPKA